MPSWVITGASRGIGYAWIKHLASTPDNKVIAIVRNEKATQDRLASDGIDNVSVVTADVTDLSALRNAAQRVSQTTGGSLDYLILNAAMIIEKSDHTTALDDTPEDLAQDLVASFQANVVGVAYTLDSFLPLIRKGTAKKVVVTSTGMADLDLINRFDIAVGVPYTVSKAAVNALTAKYHAALGKKEGILLFTMSPGFVNTREGKQMTEQEMEGARIMAAQFADYAPNFKGPITPQESVQHQLAVIHSATVESHGGAFVSHYGNKQWL